MDTRAPSQNGRLAILKNFKMSAVKEINELNGRKDRIKMSRYV